jgi:hypothetical protein
VADDAVGVVDDDDEDAAVMPACNSVGVNAAPVDDDDDDDPAALVKCDSADGSRIDMPAAVGELAANSDDAAEANAVGELAPPMPAAEAADAVLSASESADVDEAEETEDEDEDACPKSASACSSRVTRAD